MIEYSEDDPGCVGVVIVGIVALAVGALVFRR